MEYLTNGITMEVPDGCFPLSTDSMVLAFFAGRMGCARVLDLGSGCATLGLLLAAGNEKCTVTGIESDSTAHAAAQGNIGRNGLGLRLESICADLNQVPSLFPPGSFDCCISNPPYFSGGPASASLPRARQEITCTLEDLMRSAAWALKYGGDFFLVHRPERLGEIIAQGSRHALEAKRLALVRHRTDAPVSLVLVQLRKGGKPGLKFEDYILREANGNPTALYREIYHIMEE